VKIALFVLAAILVILGLLWALQGLNVLAGSAMSGHQRWTLIGGVVAVVGIIVAIVAARKKSK